MSAFPLRICLKTTHPYWSNVCCYCGNNRKLRKWFLQLHCFDFLFLQKSNEIYGFELLKISNILLQKVSQLTINKGCNLGSIYRRLLEISLKLNKLDEIGEILEYTAELNTYSDDVIIQFLQFKINLKLNSTEAFNNYLLIKKQHETDLCVECYVEAILKKCTSLAIQVLHDLVDHFIFNSLSIRQKSAVAKLTVYMICNYCEFNGLDSLENTLFLVDSFVISN